MVFASLSAALAPPPHSTIAHRSRTAIIVIVKLFTANTLFILILLNYDLESDCLPEELVF